MSNLPKARLLPVTTSMQAESELRVRVAEAISALTAEERQLVGQYKATSLGCEASLCLLGELQDLGHQLGDLLDVITRLDSDEVLFDIVGVTHRAPRDIVIQLGFEFIETWN